MNSAPQVHTAEISDAELDEVSGGLAQGPQLAQLAPGLNGALATSVLGAHVTGHVGTDGLSVEGGSALGVFGNVSLGH